MASQEATEALLAGPQSWEAFSKIQRAGIDLTMLDLAGRDLSTYSFTNVNLSGADLEGANLDNTRWRDVTARNCVLSDCSMVATTFHKVAFDGGNLAGATFRQATISKVSFVGSSLADVSMKDVELDRTVLDDTLITNLRLMSCRLNHCTFRHLDSTNVLLKDLLGDELVLLDVRLRRSTLTRSTFCSASIDQVFLIDCNTDGLGLRASSIERLSITTPAKHMDLTDSEVRYSSLIGFGLPTIVMRDTTVVECAWPRQTGTTSPLGGYRSSDHLLRQPVQDVQGISQVMRREIADAQYLKERHEQVESLADRALLRLWGLTCNFGRSLKRLAVFTGTLLALHAAVFIVTTGEMAHGWPTLETIKYACSTTSAAFLSLGDGVPDESLSYWTASVLLSARVTGFAVLGMYISVAANLLWRLSAE